MFKKRKFKNYILECHTSDNVISIPIKSLQISSMKLTSYSNLEVTGLNEARLIGNIEGSCKIELWETDDRSHSAIQKEIKYLQNSHYSLYISHDLLYVVKIDNNTSR